MSRKREYTTSEGTVLEFSPVSSWTINHINMKWERCKPIPPTITTYLNDNPQMAYQEYNENDAKYKQALSIWNGEKASEMNEVMVRLGIRSEPPAEFVEKYSEMFPDIEPQNIKVHWVYSLLNEEEITQFFEVVMGQTTVTEKGLEQAKATFPSVD